ncbi:MAG: PilZ domain-containing protein [Betaproteobacteria bacterium]|nr:PilZ domain-containing protein [Betaproteobacteria bacterium]
MPATVRLSHHHTLAVKMIELSLEGVRFLCPMAPEINSEVELRFTLPSKHTHELRLMANVRHLFEVHATPGTPPDYRYAAGVNFMNLRENERLILDTFLMK